MVLRELKNLLTESNQSPDTDCKILPISGGYHVRLLKTVHGKHERICSFTVAIDKRAIVFVDSIKNIVYVNLDVKGSKYVPEIDTLITTIEDKYTLADFIKIMQECSEYDLS